jgi:2-phospho-L-lactate guanylyltransferase
MPFTLHSYSAIIKVLGQFMIVVLIPIKALTKAKSRLRPIEESIRIEIIKAMLRDVIDAYINSKSVERVILITPDTNVKDIVKEFDIDIIKDDGVGQIEAYFKGIDHALKNYGYKLNSLIFGVADTPFISSYDVNTIARVYQEGFEAVLVPSIDGGTNVMLQKYPLAIELMHGENSFKRHLFKAFEKRIKVYIYSSIGSFIDIDTVEDIVVAKYLCEYIYRDDKGICKVLYRLLI